MSTGGGRPDDTEEPETAQRPWHGGPWERRFSGTRSPEIPFTPEEMDVLEGVAQDNGWIWTFAHACLCLDQARAIGDLPQNGRTVWPEGFLCGTRRKTN